MRVVALRAANRAGKSKIVLCKFFGKSCVDSAICGIRIAVEQLEPFETMFDSTGCVHETRFDSLDERVTLCNSTLVAVAFGGAFGHGSRVSRVRFFDLQV